MLTKVKGLSFYDEEGKAVLPQPRGDVTTGAWFGSEALKANTVEKMRKHREQDQITQGLYQAGLLTGISPDDDEDDAGEFKGCLVGCTLPPMNVEWYARAGEDNWPIKGELWHVLVERFYNIQNALARRLDHWFEDQFEADAPDFAVNALEAIPVGAVYSDEDFDDMFNLNSDDVDGFINILCNPTEIRGVAAA